MKKIVVTLIRKLISPSMRFNLREKISWLREQLDRARFWRWEIARLPWRENGSYSIFYVGRKSRRELAQILLGIKDATQTETDASSQTVLVSELPIPFALCVPKYLRAIVPLGRPIEEIMAEFDSELRRSIRKKRPHYRMQQALSDTDIEYADRELLRPYASARHGNSANQMPLETVRRFAKEFGRLDFVLKDDNVIACLLGTEYVCAGERYWILDRFGYHESIFSDPKKLGETNSMNNHLELEWAIESGYDYYDIALVFARPDDGLLKWKKRRGATLRTIGLRGYSHFYLRLPRVGAAKFLWDAPLFAMERHKLTLHLGLPDGLNDDEITNRFHEMGFNGLSKVYLHCVKLPSEQLLEMVQGLYAQHKSQPHVEVIAST